MNFNRAVALRTSKLLAERKMSKYALEKATGLTHSALRYIFNEINKDIKFSTVAKIANAFGMTLAEFVDDPVFDLSKIDY